MTFPMAGIPYVNSTPAVDTTSFIIKVTGSSYKLATVNSGTYSFDVDWGDGSTDTGITTYNDSRLTHTYPNSDLWTIKISGTFHGIMHGDNTTTANANKLSEIVQFGNMRLGSSGQQFRKCSNLILDNVLDYPDTSTETSLDSLFRDANGITSIPFFNNWNVENVIYMGSLASNASNFNADCSAWVTTSLQKLGNAFYLTKFQQDISNWNVSNVDNFTSCIRLVGTNYPTEYLDAIYTKWSLQSVKVNQKPTISGNYTLGGTAEAGRNVLKNTYGWTLTDNGGI